MCTVSLQLHPSHSTTQAKPGHSPVQLYADLRWGWVVTPLAQRRPSAHPERPRLRGQAQPANHAKCARCHTLLACKGCLRLPSAWRKGPCQAPRRRADYASGSRSHRLGARGTLVFRRLIAGWYGGPAIVAVCFGMPGLHRLALDIDGQVDLQIS